MGEQPSGGGPIRDATGLVVGSPEWLARQRKIERGQTPEKLKRQGTWQIVLGVIIVAIAVFVTVTLIRGENSLGLRLAPRGFLTFLVFPLVVGGAVIINGMRQRGGRLPERATPPDTWPAAPGEPSPRDPATGPYASPPVDPTGGQARAE